MEIANLGDFIAALKSKQEQSIRAMENRADTRPLVGKLFDFWDRGQRDETWHLQPKVFRNHYNERDLTNRFKVLSKSRHMQSPEYDNYGLFLSLMQHYGLPTRLLDWSTSPLVGLYFAVEKYIYEPNLSPIDAAVWLLNPYRLNKIELEDPTTPSIEGWSVRKFLRPAFTSYGPASANFNESVAEDHLKDGEDKICAVMGVETDSRIFAQQGCFTVHTAPTPLQSAAAAPRFLDKILIPSASVRTIAEEMLLCGFRKSTLFPDLTNLAEDLEAGYR